MSDLKSRLSSYGMAQYYLRFAEAGFGTWETILDITEDDLESLGVQRGHRRRLQQEIAFYLNSGAEPEGQKSRALSRPDSYADMPIGVQRSQKRQYTRHPRPDPNAPQRPPSAYVLFSNSVRDNMKDQRLSFAETSKIVGDRWQNMSEATKNEWKQTASGPWEKYKSDQEQYEATDGHRGYQAYLAEFGASHPSKRRKAPSKKTSGLVDSTAPDPGFKQSPGSDVQPSSALKNLAAAPVPYTDHPVVSSPTPGSSRSRKLGSGDDTSASLLTVRDRSSQVFSHACEVCRKKKVKCDGVTPSCGKCRKSNNECRYAGGIRDREKRLVEDVVEKLNAWEGSLRRMKPQLEGDHLDEINRLLSMSPKTSKVSKVSPGQMSDSSDSDGGESNVSNVGSMGSTDNFNEESLKAETGDGRIDAFLGQTATDNWVDRLENSLNIIDRDEPRKEDRSSNVGGAGSHNVGRSILSAATGFHTGTREAPTLEAQWEPYELPVKASADLFVGAYFSTAHPSFPILSRILFLREYENFFASSTSVQASDSTFMPILHLVLAIGAIHLYITQTPWALGDRSYLWNFAKAKAAVLDAYTLQVKELEQVQLCGLGGLYYLIMYEINKAWNFAGLSTRCAQALGLHLLNSAPNMSDSKRDLRLSVWFSVLTLERTVTVITGRPSMIRDTDCSVTLPNDGAIDPDKHLQNLTSSANKEVWSTTPGPSLGVVSGQAWARIPTSPVTINPTFFLHHTQLSSIANLTLTRLYSPHVRHTKWSELQTIIQELNRVLHNWNTNLSVPYQTNTPRQKSETDLARIGVGMLFHSTRIIINRPCHCRLDQRIADQSTASNSFNVDSAIQCVSSALSILAFVPDQPDPANIYQGPMWWMFFHHFKRAATVLILEITFLSEHAPPEGHSSLVDAKKAVNWLHAMGASSSPAYSSWVTLSRLLHRAAQRFGGDLSDVFIAEGQEEHNVGSAAQDVQGQQMPDSFFSAEPPDFIFGEFGQGGLDGDWFGGFQSNVYDGFSSGPTQGTLYPSGNETDGMYGRIGGEEG